MLFQLMVKGIGGHLEIFGGIGGHLEILGVCSPMSPSSAVGHGRNRVPFARRVCGNAEKYHTLKAQRYRRKPRREPRLGPRREPRRVWLRSIGGYLGGFWLA